MEKGVTISRAVTDLWGSLKDGDFEEADVWDVLEERKESNYSKRGTESPPATNLSSAPSSAQIMVPVRTSRSSDYKDKSVRKQQQSAPVRIPDWSKLTRKEKSNKKPPKNNHRPDDSDSGDEDVIDDCKVPPHEYMAQRPAKSRVSSFSVFEGVGRTLKGRDLSRVRDAVLTRTGFIE